MGNHQRGEDLNQTASQPSLGGRSSTGKLKGVSQSLSMASPVTRTLKAYAMCRTHRERKELYIKALEEQVMKLKETYSSVVQDKNAIAEENRKLKELLRLHGIAFPGLDQFGQNVAGGVSSYGGSSSGSQSGSYSQNQSFSPPTTVGSAITPPNELNMQAGSELIGGPQSHQQRHQQQGLDYDRIGIDFVLTSVERPQQSPHLSPPPPRHHR